jgi:hypothetical protein
MNTHLSAQNVRLVHAKGLSFQRPFKVPINIRSETSDEGPDMVHKLIPWFVAVHDAPRLDAGTQIRFWRYSEVLKQYIKMELRTCMPM